VLILCPNCNGSLPEWLLRNRLTKSLCPSCYSDLTVELFPALLRKQEAIDERTLRLGEGEASCFEHATKRAVSLCNHCGRFLCGLCEVEIEGKVWCPACLELDKPAPRLSALEKRRTLYDSIALALATWPAVLMFSPSVITAPMVVYLAIRHWKTPSSLVPRSKWRFVVALIVAGLELGLIVFVVVSIVAAARSRLQ
jgi:hypothetical protein